MKCVKNICCYHSRSLFSASCVIVHCCRHCVWLLASCWHCVVVCVCCCAGCWREVVADVSSEFSWLPIRLAEVTAANQRAGCGGLRNYANENATLHHDLQFSKLMRHSRRMGILAIEPVEQRPTLLGSRIANDLYLFTNNSKISSGNIRSDSG
jgi:hypothetical protein